MSTKSVLKKTVAKKILANQEWINSIASETDSSEKTIIYQLRNENPKLTQPHYLDVISKLTGIDTKDLYDIIPYEKESHLRTD